MNIVKKMTLCTALGMSLIVSAYSAENNLPPKPYKINELNQKFNINIETNNLGKVMTDELNKINKHPNSIVTAQLVFEHASNGNMDNYIALGFGNGWVIVGKYNDNKVTDIKVYTPELDQLQANLVSSLAFADGYLYIGHANFVSKYIDGPKNTNIFTAMDDKNTKTVYTTSETDSDVIVNTLQIGTEGLVHAAEIKSDLIGYSVQAFIPTVMNDHLYFIVLFSDESSILREDSPTIVFSQQYNKNLSNYSVWSNVYDNELFEYAPYYKVGVINADLTSSNTWQFKEINNIPDQKNITNILSANGVLYFGYYDGTVRAMRYLAINESQHVSLGVYQVTKSSGHPVKGLNYNYKNDTLLINHGDVEAVKFSHKDGSILSYNTLTNKQGKLKCSSIVSAGDNIYCANSHDGVIYQGIFENQNKALNIEFEPMRLYRPTKKILESGISTMAISNDKAKLVISTGGTSSKQSSGVVVVNLDSNGQYENDNIIKNPVDCKESKCAYYSHIYFIDDDLFQAVYFPISEIKMTSFTMGELQAKAWGATDIYSFEQNKWQEKTNNYYCWTESTYEYEAPLINAPQDIKAYCPDLQPR